MQEQKQAGVWIDHRMAIVIGLKDGRRQSVVRIDSEVPGRRKASGSAGAPLPGHLGGDDESSRRRRREGALRRYYDCVIDALGVAEAIVVLGPGEAKQELRTRLEQAGRADRIVAIEAIDELTEPQIVAAVQSHFGRTPPRMIASPGPT